MSVGLLSFYFGKSKLISFLAKVEHTLKELLFVFLNEHNPRSFKSVKNISLVKRLIDE